MRDLSHIKTVVIKIGTALLSSDTGIDNARIDIVCEQIAAIKQKGIHVILVTSGAIGLGAKEIKHNNKVCYIPLRQACAAIGQPILMQHYRESFNKYNILCSQVLINKRDLNNRKSYINLRASVSTLLSMGVVPIFNENDTVSTAEIGAAFGDNDRMCAMVASKIDADLLVLLTDVDAVYTANPKVDINAKKLDEIKVVDSSILALAGGAGSTFSTGGMKTKLLAAQIAGQASCATIIAHGREENIITRLLDGEELGTYIYPSRRLTQLQRWILNNSKNGKLIVDDGAVNALRNHKSLLFKGLVDVQGNFSVDDVVEIVTLSGVSFAKAKVNYSSNDLVLFKGLDSKEVFKLSGKKDYIFRPDDMVIISNE